MKTPSIIALLLCVLGMPVSMQAQNKRWYGDTIFPVRVINFDTISPYIIIDTAANNIWQTGVPQKIFFNSAYSPNSAILTDTINNYPPNNYSFFDLIIGGFNMSWYPFDIFISIKHKFDTDTLADGGYITVSWDKGLTWTNIIEDWGLYHNPSNCPEASNIYTMSDTLYTGAYGYSGRSNGWIQTVIPWHDIAVKQWPPADTMILRFNFISDNIDNPGEGWMIDDIKLFALDVLGAVDEVDTPIARLQPNPVSTSAEIILDRTYRTAHIDIYDSKGTRVRQAEFSDCEKITLQRDYLVSGIYCLKLTLEGNRVITKKMVIGG
ncbi:MAG: T9SS type A sorting domain-containing protein [Bacteroidota bacterium]